MRAYSILFILITGAFYWSCDKVEIPIPKPTVIITPNDSIPFPIVDSANLNRSFRKTYVEEFTGHKCITCPANTALLLEQQTENKERMIVVSVHAGSFADVDDTDYPTDFRTPYGDRLFIDIGMNGQAIPSSIINRKTFENFENKMIFSSAPQWTAPIDFENTNTEANFALGVQADYIDSLGQLFISVSAEVLSPVSDLHRLLILCLEDSVVAEQLDQRADPAIHPKRIVKDYVHRHVLRGNLVSDQSISGTPFISSGTAIGEWIDYTLNAYMPSNVVNPENTHIVAVLVNDVTLEVAQSEETHVHVK